MSIFRSGNVSNVLFLFPGFDREGFISMPYVLFFFFKELIAPSFAGEEYKKYPEM